MAKQVDFKNVAKQVRYDILGSFKMPVPEDFQMLSDKEQFELYNRLYELHHDCCRFLSASLEIDELNQDYKFNDYF